MSTHDRTTAPLRMRMGAPLLLGVVLLVGWQVTVAWGTVSASMLPAPLQVLQRLGHDLGNGTLLGYAGVTLQEAILGCLLAVVIALPLGYLVARRQTLAAATSPYLAASQALPAVALAPLLVLWVGYGLLPVVLLCALLVFFPVVLGTRLGVRTLDPDILEAAALDGAHGWSMLRCIEAPLALPAIFTGLRNGFTLSITGAVVGEFVMGGKGLGMVLSVTAAGNDTTGLFATLVVLCALAIAMYFALLAIEKTFDPL